MFEYYPREELTITHLNVCPDSYKFNLIPNKPPRSSSNVLYVNYVCDTDECNGGDFMANIWHTEHGKIEIYVIQKA